MTDPTDEPIWTHGTDTDPLETAIRRNLNRLVTGQLSIRGFEDWFIPATWDVESGGDEQTRRLAFAVLHLLNDRSLGLLSEQEVLNLLRPFADPHAAVVAVPELMEDKG